MNTRLLGAMGEQAAARYLRVNGYEICGANFVTGVGEIDIIAKQKDVICFIEVKTRSLGGIARPADAVDYRKQENIKGSAAAYMTRFSLKNKIRFDIIEVLVDENEKIKNINHIKNAF